MVLVVLRILNTFLLDFCVVSEFMVLFMAFNFGAGPGFILGAVVNF